MMRTSFRSVVLLMLVALILGACGQAGTGGGTAGGSTAASTAASSAGTSASAEASASTAAESTPASAEPSASAAESTAASAEASASAPASEAASGSAGAATSGEKVKITYGVWDETQKEGIQKVIDAFQQANPNVTVEIQLTPWTQYWDNLKTAAAGGELYDVFWMNGPSFPFYASKGVLLNLQPYIDKDKFDTSKYPQGILDLYKWQGNQYGGPRDFDTIALYYNKDMFDKAGIPYPDASWDWNKLRDVAKQLTKAPDQFGFVDWYSGQEQTFNFVFSNGGEIIKDKKCALNQPPAVEAIQYLVDLIYKDKVSEQPAAMGQDPTTFFQQGKAAMITTGSWNVNAYKKSITGFKWNVAPLPKAPNGQSVSVIHGIGNVVNAKTKYPDQAWAFLKFMASEEGQKILGSSGTQIPTYEGLATTWQEANKDVNTQVFLDATKNGHPYPATVTFTEWDPILSNGMTQIFNNQVPVTDGLNQVCQQMDDVLKNEP